MKRAIALCGGGSRGSYEIGVWTALKELRIDYQLVTGTSIGAINGALMVQDDYEKAKNLWDTISIHQVIATNFSLDYSLKAIYSQKKDFFQFLKNYIVNKGADITPFVQLLEETIDENKVMYSDVDFGITTVRFPFIKPLEITKKQLAYKI